MAFQITPFNSGRVKGVKVYFFSKPGEPDHKTDCYLDLTQAFLKGWIDRIASVRMFNQYATLRLQDGDTGIDYFSSASAQVCFPIPTLAKRWTINRYDNLASAGSFELVFYEDEQQTYNVLAVIP